MSIIRNNGIALVSSPPDWTPTAFDTTIAKQAEGDIFYFWNSSTQTWRAKYLRDLPEITYRLLISQTGTSNPVIENDQDPGSHQVSVVRESLGTYYVENSFWDIEEVTVYPFVTLVEGSAATSVTVSVDAGDEKVYFYTKDITGTLVDLEGSLYLKLELTAFDANI